MSSPYSNARPLSVILTLALLYMEHKDTQFIKWVSTVLVLYVLALSAEGMAPGLGRQTLFKA